MVPKIAKKGASFKGAAAYYLHDKGASTDERVEWTETRNLATDDADLAWRIMAATASCQDRLKSNAGIKATGRKSADVVMTYSIAWHPDEKKSLTREEMAQAAYDSLEALGAENHQALLVCHSDEPHPHVHIMLNRVSPEDGRMLSSSKEKLNLSRWAQTYEETRGKVWCKERVKNNFARDVRREFTRAAKDKPRHIFEIESKSKALAQRRPAEAKALSELEKQKDAALSRKGREMHERHQSQWRELSAQHKARRKVINAETHIAIKQVKKEVGKSNQPARESLEKRQLAEQRLFERREKRLAGKVQNAVDAIRSSNHPREKIQRRVARAFNYLSSSAKRQYQLNRSHTREQRKFNAQENKQIAAKQDKLRLDGKDKQKSNLERFYTGRKDVQFKQTMDQAKLRAEWKQRNVDRKAAWKEFRVGQFLTKHGVGGAERQRDRGIERER